MSGQLQTAKLARENAEDIESPGSLIDAITARVMHELQQKADLWQNLLTLHDALPRREDQKRSICFGSQCPKTRSIEHQIQNIVRDAVSARVCPVSYSKGGLAPWQLRKVVAMVETMLDRPIVLKTLAEALGLSVKHFSRAFRVSTGLAPHRWIQSQRLERARRMLSNSDEPIAVVAQMCGFSDQSHLTATFRKLTGQTPGSFRRSNRDDDAPGARRLHLVSEAGAPGL